MDQIGDARIGYSAQQTSDNARQTETLHQQHHQVTVFEPLDFGLELFPLAGDTIGHAGIGRDCGSIIWQVWMKQIAQIEKTVKGRIKLKPQFRLLLTVSGIGQILGLTIMLETGPISRFAKVGNYASYCRCVGSKWMSNGKRKGRGNTKNGNKYLAWAFVEAAHFAVRYNSRIKQYYQRKQDKTNSIVATKTVAHKLARACYYIMRDEVQFDVNKAFG